MAFTNTAWGLSTDRDVDWRERAVCRHVDPEVMWPMPKSAAVEMAVVICQPCPVKLECLIQGAGVGDWESVRGGLSGNERQRYHRQGMEPADYPGHNARTRRCNSCNAMFFVDPQHGQRRLCPDCGAQRRAYSKMRDIADGHRKLAAAGFSTAEIAHALGYATSRGLRAALARAREAGLLTAEEVSA